MGETRDFTAEKDETTILEFRLKRATCKVYGTVTGEAGQPLQAEISLHGSGGIIIEKTLSDAKTGYYEFHLRPGTYLILPRAPKRDIQPWEGSISADTKVDLKLAVMSTDYVSGFGGTHYRPRPYCK